VRYIYTTQPERSARLQLMGVVADSNSHSVRSKALPDKM
jgi:hypothetical protein